MKLVGHSRWGNGCGNGPKTPLKRVLDTGAADPDKIQLLVDPYTSVSPLTLKCRSTTLPRCPLRTTSASSRSRRWKPVYARCWPNKQ
jgi:hypothetical protein